MAAPLLAGCLVFWFLLTNCVAPFYVQGPPPGAPEAAFKRALDREVPGVLRQFGVPGMAIGVMIHGDPGPVYAYGLADKQRKRPMTARTVFEVASLSKSVTAWGVLTLVDAGKVDLDQPAANYLAAWPLAPSRFPAGAVTIRQLLTHTAGVNAATDEFRQPGERAATPAQLLAREGPSDHGRPTPAILVAPAGKAFLYSAPGYTLLQMLIEQQSGRPFQAYMRDAVLRPLGMNSSTYDGDAALRNSIATPYRSDGRARRILVPQDTAADGLFSTVGDMVRFIAAPVPGQGLPVGAGVISGSVANEIFLRPSSLQTSRGVTLGPDAPCMGCFIEKSAGGPVFVTNTGADPGWTTEIHTVPSTGDGLVVLTNSSRGGLAIAEVEAIWAAWRGLPAPQMTRALRTLGGLAIALVGLATALVIAAGFACLNDAMAGRRRFAAFHLNATCKSLLDAGLAGIIGYQWFLRRALFALLPEFALVLKADMACLILLVIARALFPEVKLAGRASKRAGGASR